MRKFVTGVVLGGVVAAGGLAVVSQIAPMAGAKLAAPETGVATGVATRVATGVVAPEPVGTEGATPAVEPGKDSETAAQLAETPPAASDTPQTLNAAEAETDEPLLRPSGDADAPPPAAVVPDLTQPTAVPDAPEPDAAPEPGQVETAATEPEVAEAEVAPEAAAAAEVAPEAAPETAPEAEPETAATPDSTAEAPAAETGTEPAAPDAVGQAETIPAPAKDPATVDNPAESTKPSQLEPDAQLADKPVDGVTTGRLPSIGDPANAAPETAAEAVPAVAPSPFRGFARAFENPDAKPLFAILLVDNGAADVPRAELSALPFPVTFVLDPMAEGAEAAATLYREAGQEVVMLASAIPKGAKASDLEQSFAGMEGKLPQAVALIDTAEARFQDDRNLSAEVVTLLADQRLGLVTFDRGLNAADQVARREGLPAATIFRSIDDDGEEAPVIRRYLDRAAFKAAQEGAVAVLGTARPETIAAMMEWAVEGRASSVSLAPISALMLNN